MSDHDKAIPSSFFWRRLHSILGLWLVGFLMIHLLTNSQAALFLGEDGAGFIKSVSDIHNLPYLIFIEFFLLAIPFFIHIVWGIKYLQTAKYNSKNTDGTIPSLPEYPRNHAYTWQRVTAWVLIFLILGHVIQMRFLEVPQLVKRENQKLYLLPIQEDSGIKTVAKRLNVDLIKPNENNLLWNKEIPSGSVITVSKDFGTAELLLVRETFKSPLMIILYTILVLASCFHAFNGVWTFLITWGVTLSTRSQNISLKLSYALMGLIAFLGLASIWGTYWLNLKE